MKSLIKNPTKNRMKRALLLFVTAFMFVTSISQAQSSSTSMVGYKRKIATVMFAGLGGAVLGLSTLSFYGEPEEHIGNIWAGLAVGLIGGAVFVSMDSMNTNSTDYGKIQWPQNPSQRTPKPPSLLAYNWNF